MNWPNFDMNIGYPDKIPPEKNPPEKIPLNAIECEPVPTREQVRNSNASEASYKPKQRFFFLTFFKKIQNFKKIYIFKKKIIFTWKNGNQLNRNKN